MMNPVQKYIKESWSRTKMIDKNGSGFRGIDLPYPYSPPCIVGEGKFTFFFYWDTFWTNEGLLLSGEKENIELAKNNIQNMFWLIERHGFMPNHVGLENRSHPPMLCRMLRSYFENTGDEAFLKEGAKTLLREYHWWMSARLSPLGLNQFGFTGSEEVCEFWSQRPRVAKIVQPEKISKAERIRAGAHHIAEAECGADFTPRFDKRCLDHVQPEVNTLLWEYELLFAEMTEKYPEAWNYHIDWQTKANERKEKIQEYCWSEKRGLFMDYNFVDERHSSIAALTGFWPLSSGLPTEKQAKKMVESLDLFEREYGLAYSEDYAKREKIDTEYQWAYPNSWPPMMHLMVSGFRKYGFDKDAKRIAKKHLANTDTLFEKSGRLFEKINAVTGEPAGGEYEAAAMMGWTAGIYTQFMKWYG